MRALSLNLAFAGDEADLGEGAKEGVVDHAEVVVEAEIFDEEIEGFSAEALEEGEDVVFDVEVIVAYHFFAGDQE